MSSFRTVFPRVGKANSWFPLHMATGIRKIQQILKEIDCIIEVHDARIPISGRSSSFYQQVINGKPHLLILNKMDLIDMNFKNDIDKKLLGSCDRLLYTSAGKMKNENIEKIIPMVYEIIDSKSKYNRADKCDVNILIAGVPNVGKSSLINCLRSTLLGRPQVMAVAPHAGVTKTISTKLKIGLNPVTYIYDTPGILEPNLTTSPECAMRLAACGLVKDDSVGQQLIADYILFWFNRRKLFHYANMIGLNQPTDNIIEVLSKIAINQNFIFSSKDLHTRQFITRLDTLEAAKHFIKMFREGTFGTYLLDDDLIYRSRRTGLAIAV